MVALLHPNPEPGRLPRSSRRLQLIVDNEQRSPPIGGRGPAGPPGRAARWGEEVEVEPGVMSGIRVHPMALVVAALLVFGPLFALWAIQGGPSADGSGQIGPSVGAPPRAEPGSSRAVIVARPGDSMWSIAQRLSPNADPRPAVDQLIAANGGSTIRVGQQIVIPEQLLD